MNRPVTYVEINSPDHIRTARFFSTAFGWDPQPFASPDYLVSPGGEAAGVDTAFLYSRDGNLGLCPSYALPILMGHFAMRRPLAARLPFPPSN